MVEGLREWRLVVWATYIFLLSPLVFVVSIVVNREELLKKPVRDLMPTVGLRVSELVEMFGRMGGFMARRVYEAAELVFQMASDKDCYVFLSFPANIVATGLRGVIAGMVRAGMVDAIITTGGTIDHDIARSFSEYYHGFFEADDLMLRKLEIHRLGNIFIPLENYGPLIERVVRNMLRELTERRNKWSPSELARELGARIRDENSILRQAYLRNVPIYVPGVVDSSFGTQLFFYAQTSEFELDLFSDMKRILDTVFESERTGGIVVGGGISKHHLIWWNQFKEGLDYSVYITTAVEWDGSLSGALPREAISWGKLRPKAKHTTVYGDATVILPLIFYYVLDRLSIRGEAGG